MPERTQLDNGAGEWLSQKLKTLIQLFCGCKQSSTTVDGKQLKFQNSIFSYAVNKLEITIDWKTSASFAL